MQIIMRYIVAVKSDEDDKLLAQERATSNTLNATLDHAVLTFGVNIHFNIHIDGCDKL